MRSVADDLRIRTTARILDMSVPERIALALRLGDDDATQFARARGIDPGRARRQLAASRTHGRTPSVCAGPR